MPGSIRPRAGRGRDVWELRVYLGRDGRGRSATRASPSAGPRRRPNGSSPDSWPSRTASRSSCLTTTRGAGVLVRRSTTPSRAGEPTAGTICRRPPCVATRTAGRSTSRTRLASGKSRRSGPTRSSGTFGDSRQRAWPRPPYARYGRILHRSCRLARKWSGGTLPNPIAGTELPDWTLAERGPEVRSPTVDEVRSLLKAARDYDLRASALIRFVAATGVRRGEVCALRWDDVDWDTALVRVDESIVADVDGAKVKAPKTRASIRPVAVDQGTLAELRELRSEQEALASASGETVGAKGLRVLDRAFRTDSAPSRQRQPRLPHGAGASWRGRGHPSPLAQALPVDAARRRSLGGPEASPVGLGNRAHGSALHRCAVCGGSQGGRPYGRGARLDRFSSLPTRCAKAAGFVDGSGRPDG